MKRIVQRELFKLAEEKYWDRTLELGPFGAAPGVTWTGSMIKLANIVEGLDVNQRIGKKVSIKNVQFRWAINFPWTGTQVITWQVRCLVFIWKGEETPTRDDIITFPPTPTEAFVTIAPLNHDNENVLFHMLYDKNLDASAYNGIPPNYDILSFDSLYKEHGFNMDISTMKNDCNIINFITDPGPPIVITQVNQVYCLFLSYLDPVLFPYTWNTFMSSRVTYADP